MDTIWYCTKYRDTMQSQRSTVFYCISKKVNLCSHRSSYSLSSHVGAMLVFCMLCRTIVFKRAQNWVSVSDGSQIVKLNGSEFHKVGPMQQNGRNHNWLIQTPVSPVQLQSGMLAQPDADTCTPGYTFCILYAVEWAANVVDLECRWWCGRTSQYDSSCGAEHIL